MTNTATKFMGFRIIRSDLYAGGWETTIKGVTYYGDSVDEMRDVIREVVAVKEYA